MEQSDQKEAVPVRDSLIATAVAFLKNEKVKTSSLEDKKLFLLKKGLTNIEIEEAIKLSNIPFRQEISHIEPPSFFSKLSGFFSTVFFVTSSAYTLYHLYKNVIKPLLFGHEKKKDEEILQKMLNNSKEMNDNILAMVAALNDLHRQVARSNSELLLNNNSQESKLASNEMKEELKSLKAILLSRDQFPSTSKAASIPAWQLSAKTNNPSNHSDGTVVNGTKVEEVVDDD